MAKPKSKHDSGDFLFKDSTPEAKKLHQLYKGSARQQQRQDFMRQRAAERSQFQK